MNKKDRQLVFDKYCGRCAYCGKKLGNRWHADHIVPALRGWKDDILEREQIKRGEHSVENMYPSCARCNGWKATLSVEQFRKEIEQQVTRARAYSCNFRMAEDFGLIRTANAEVIFYFEKH